jgi:hypothetical protein
LSSSTRDDRIRTERGVAVPSSLSGEQLAELLSAVVNAPDFSTAARFFVAQFADLIGAERACALMVNARTSRLEAIATLGLDRELAPIALAERQDPFVLATLAFTPVSCPRDT